MPRLLEAPLERLGFTLEGEERESSWEEDGTFRASAMYGLLRSEFSGRLWIVNSGQ